jgi:hypothetical protein
MAAKVSLESFETCEKLVLTVLRESPDTWQQDSPTWIDLPVTTLTRERNDIHIKLLVGRCFAGRGRQAGRSWRCFYGGTGWLWFAAGSLGHEPQVVGRSAEPSDPQRVGGGGGSHIIADQLRRGT